MKKCLLCFIAILPLCFVVMNSFAQTGQQLTIYRTFGGLDFEFRKDTITYPVSPKQVLHILGDDPLAYAEFKKARTNSTVAGLMGFIGGGMIAVPIGTAIVGGQSEWGLAVGGAALIIASIPFNKSYKRHAKGAVDTYNKKHTAFRLRAEYFLSGIGARVIIRF